jgi:hypothetical protein
MKKLPILLAIFALSFIGCEKEQNPPPVEKDPEELLTDHAWKIQEIRYLYDNFLYYYKRGAAQGNTDNFDNESIEFNTDKTGVYKRNNITYNLTWEFTNPEKTKLVMDINFPEPLHIFWENITLTESDLKYTEYYTFKGLPNLTVSHRISTEAMQ